MLARRKMARFTVAQAGVRAKSASTRTGTIYRGCGLHSDAIGEYKNGTIYTGLGLHSREIGEYKDGTIYRGTGWSSTPIGEYKDGSDGVAAAALLLLAADLL